MKTQNTKEESILTPITTAYFYYLVILSPWLENTKDYRSEGFQADEFKILSLGGSLLLCLHLN